MTLAFLPPPCPSSPLQRLDPRWKLAGFLVLAIVSALVRTLPASALALGIAWLLVGIARVPVRWYFLRLAPLLLFLACFTLPLPFLYRDDIVWRWGWLTLSQRGLVLAAFVCAKGIALVSMMLVLLASAPLHTTLKAAQSLRIPRLLLLLLLLSYRYIFLLTEELLRLRIAVRVRGYRNRPTLHSYKTIAHLCSTLLVRGSDRAERVHHAMRCRGFDGEFHALTDFQTHWFDVVGFGLLCLLGGVLVLVDYL